MRSFHIATSGTVGHQRAEELFGTPRAAGPFLQDFETEIFVHYYASPDFGAPIYTFNSRVTNGDDRNPRHGHYPDLGRPYCYLLHDLLDHSPLHRARALTIEEVWAEVVREHRFVRLVEEW